MNNLFNYDSNYVRSMTKAVDAFLLGILWLLCSLPIFTSGAASAAFYYAFNKSVRQGLGYPTREFFRSFKANFKQATILWLILFALALMLCLDLFILTSGALEIGMLAPLLMVTSILIFAILSVWSLCAFPYMARFENPMKNMLKNSLVVALANMHWALLLLVLFAGAAVISFALPLLILFTPAAYMFLANRVLERVFRKYMCPEDLKAQQEAETQG